MLLGTDKDGKTFWYFVASWSRLDLLQEIWELAKENLTTEEIKDNLLLGTDTMGRPAWNVAERWMILDLLQEIWKWVQDKSTTKDKTYVVNIIHNGNENVTGTWQQMMAKYIHCRKYGNELYRIYPRMK